MPLEHPLRARRARGTVLVAATWLVVVILGWLQAQRWSTTPGPTGGLLQRWPAESRLTGSGRVPRLLVFAHPLCPCTSATLREVERIASRTRGRLAIDVLFCLPEGAPTEWGETESWRLASAIPGVAVRADRGGAEAARFSASTSGTALLFDLDDRLRFRGGLTPSRGHEGDSAGKSAVVSFALEGRADIDRAPVFGCPLFDQDAPPQSP